jgi:hypothetical protein
MTMNRGGVAALTAIGLTGAALVAGCGSSSKPAYCTQVKTFKDSVKTLEQVEVSVSNLNTIATDVKKVGTSAKELASAVGSEFAPQINSVKTSVGALESSVTQLVTAPSSSTLTHAASVIPAQVEALKRATKEVQEVTKSKCE